MIRTATPGIFKRGSRYVVTFRDPLGKQRKRSARTLAEARALKAQLTADVRRGEYRALSRVTFADYAVEWIQTYQGRTASGIRPETRDDYRKRLGLDERFEPTGDGAVAFFGRRLLSSIEPRDVKAYAAHVAKRGLAPNSVRLTVAPLRALLATSVEEGIIRSNPAAGVRLALATATAADDDEEQVKALEEAELRRLLAEIPDRWQLFFRLLAHSGMRIGEQLALRWQDLDLTERRLHVRRRYYRGGFAAPKSRYGRRTIPLSPELARDLGQLSHGQPDDGLVFPSERGTVVDASNLMGRVLKPAAVRAGLGQTVIRKGKPAAESWVGFHTLRHTAATMLFRHGLNAKQVQAWMGHHSPAFTLATYVHLLPGDLPDVTILDRLNGNTEATSPTETSRNAAEGETAETRTDTAPQFVLARAV